MSTEEKRLLDHVQANGGIKAFRDNNKELLDLEKTVNKATSVEAEGGRAHREKSKDTDDDLKKDIFEDPNTAADKNWDIFSRKFEAQKNQIIDEISHAVERASDRVIKELKSGAHERILDQVRFCMPIYLSYDRYVHLLQSIYDTWVDMVDMMQSSLRHGRIYVTDNLYRPGEGAPSRLDILSSLFETITWISPPHKFRAWGPEGLIFRSIWMRGQSNSSISPGCNPFRRQLMTTRRDSLVSPR